MVSITLREIMQRVFSTIISRHQKATKFFLVNDTYDIDIIIKDSEHYLRTGASYLGGSRNVFMKRGDALPTSKNFSDMFKNSSNKIRPAVSEGGISYIDS